MTPEQQNEVWGMVDREHLAQVARQGPAPIFATISGAHLYGFASPDSDVDLRLHVDYQRGASGGTSNHCVVPSAP